MRSQFIIATLTGLTGIATTVGGAHAANVEVFPELAANSEGEATAMSIGTLTWQGTTIEALNSPTANTNAPDRRLAALPPTQAQDKQNRPRTPVRPTNTQPASPVVPPAVNPNPTTPPTPSTTTPIPATPASDPCADPVQRANQQRVQIAEIAVRNADGTAVTPDLERQVLQAITVRSGQPTTFCELRDRDLPAIRATGAFQSVEIRPEDTPRGVRLNFIVSTYGVLRQVNIRTLPQGGSSVLTREQINRAFGSLYNQRLNVGALRDSVAKLVQTYRDGGYDLAQVIDAGELTSDGQLDIVVVEGTIEDVEIEYLNREGKAQDENGQPVRGNTQPYIISREAELRSGKIFNRTLAEQDIRRIYRLGLFDDVRLRLKDGSDPSRVRLVFQVIERKTGSVGAAGGVSSASGLFGSLSYQEQNFNGRAQKLSGEVLIGQRDLIFGLNYSDPWIGGDPSRLAYSLDIFQRRSITLNFDGGRTPVNLSTADGGGVPRILRQGGGITFTRPLSGNPFDDTGLRASLGAQYQRVTTRDANGDRIVTNDSLGNPLSFSGTGSDDLFTVQFGLSQDSRNSIIEPTAGSLWRLGLDQSVPIGSGNINFTRLRGNYTYYVPASLINLSPGPQAFVFNLQGGTTIGDLPPYEAFVLGGTSSVRGYEEGDVGSARSYVRASAEYRFPLWNIVGGAFFVDAASDLGTSNTVLGQPGVVRSKPGSGLGYGLGLRLNSPLGPIRIDYGFNDRNENRIQFGIGDQF
jgi:outer membrane protein insertion porin family